MIELTLSTVPLTIIYKVIISQPKTPSNSTVSLFDTKKNSKNSLLSTAPRGNSIHNCKYSLINLLNSLIIIPFFISSIYDTLKLIFTSQLCKYHIFLYFTFT